MSGRKSHVQWHDWLEWQDVHAALFSDDVYAQQRALSRVAAWRSRAQLPVAISATVQLLEIQLHERIAQHHHHGVGVASRSHMELSLQYSAAVVRCVNGLVDSAQKGTYAMAVSGLAQRIGIPLWIVDLRHESTHNQMPSLPVLRFAAQHLLAWLRSNYWFKQEELLRMQVLQLGDALQVKMAQLLAGDSPSIAASQQEEAKSEPIAVVLPELVEQLDADKVRNIVVPLLVYGAQFGEQVASTGLLFTIAGSSRDASQAQADDQMALYPRDALVPLLLEIQSVWRSFSAWLIASLCRKVFVLNPIEVAISAADADDDNTEPDEPRVALESQRETEICLLWTKLLVANEWREKLKFAVEPVDDLYHAGAEMLCRSEKLKPSKKTHPALWAVYERLQTILRSCKGIRTHALLTADAAITSALDASDASWMELPMWTACPLGLQYTYREMDHSILEYTLESDSIDNSQNLRAYAVAIEASDDEDDEAMMDDEDADIDTVMAELDEAYDQRLAQALELKDAVVQEVVREGQSVHQKLLPQEELQRIQSQIEIW